VFPKSPNGMSHSFLSLFRLFYFISSFPRLCLLELQLVYELICHVVHTHPQYMIHIGTEASDWDFKIIIIFGLLSQKMFLPPKTIIKWEIKNSDLSNCIS
jgi:hypothetical protein